MNVQSLIPQIDWMALAPFTTVCVAGIVALIVEMLRPRRTNNVVVGVSLLGLALAGWSIVQSMGQPASTSFAGMVTNDRFGQWLQLAMVGGAGLCVLFSEPYLREKGIPFAEFYPLSLWSLAGGMLMVGTTDLLAQFLGLEMLSISLYCLAGLSRKEGKSEESAMKYFLLGAFASAFLLLGIAMFYGATGSVNLADLSRAPADLRPYSVLAVTLLVVGLGFKMALVPFHQWTPDVYQGAPTNVTAFMAAVSKVAAVGALVRVLWHVVPLQSFWFPMLWVLAIATMCVGNLAALVQKDVKRTLAYSSIAHAGYLLVGVLSYFHAPSKVTLDATVFYLLSYSLMTIGAFAVVSLTASAGGEGTRFQDVRGLWRRAPFAAGCLVVFLCSLIGIPVTGGFFGKLLIFQNALDAGLTPLAVVLAVNSAVSAFYYLGILQAAFVADDGGVPARSARPSASLNLACTACLVGVFATGFLAGPLLGSLRMSEMGMPAGALEGAPRLSQIRKGP